MSCLRTWLSVAAVLLSLMNVGCGSNSASDSTPNPASNPSTISAASVGNLDMQTGDTTATLIWSPVPGAVSYNLYWSNSPDATPARANKLSGVTSPYVHTGLSNHVAYYYVYTAVTKAGESAPSNEVKVTPKTAAEGAPTGVTAIAGDQHITLGWEAVPGARGYNVYWNTHGDVSLRDTKVENLTFPAVHTKLTNGQPYYYIVSAISSLGEVPSAEVSTVPHIPTPNPPLTITVSSGDQQVNLNWTAVSDATAYAIYWNTTGKVSPSDNAISVTVPPYVHTARSNGTRYYYRIAALNAQGSSSLTPEVAAIPHAAPPNTPTNVTATPGNEQVTLQWDAVPNASKYNLYWDADSTNVIANVTSPYVHKRVGSGGKAVNYEVTAVSQNVESTRSALTSATPLGPLPAAPANLTVTPNRQQITLAATPVPQAISYNVYWHTPKQPADTKIITTALPYTHSGLLDNTTYTYSIDVVTPDGQSARSASVSATTLLPEAPPIVEPPLPVSYLVTASAGANGVISPASVNVVHGTTTTFTVTPTTGYSASITGCGGTRVGNTYTTGPINTACAVTASFMLNTYAVTATAGTNGAITPASTTVNHGATTSFTLAPASGYTASVSTIGCTGSLTGNTYTTGPITAACAVTASFAINAFTVTTTAGANGTITPPTVTVAQGATISFTVAPNAGYNASVTGCNGTLTGTTYTTGPITAGCAVTASFTLNTFVVTATAGANGAISPATSTVNYNATTSFTVTHSTGYTASVTGCGGTLNGTIYTTGPITGACAVTASFALNSYTVAATAGPNGAISPSSSILNYGATTSFTVSPNPGYITSVTGCGGTLTGNTYTTGPITAACAVIASFALNAFTVTATAGTNGTISPSSVSVVQGATTNFTVTPSTGYSASVTGCGGTFVGNIYTTGTITAACTVAASFTLNTYPVTATAGANGTITPASAIVNHNATTSFTLVPATGYTANVSAIGCTGSLVGTTYTTAAITAPCTVIANFALIKYPVTATSGANGSISPTSVTVDHGMRTSFTVTPNLNFGISSVTGCGGTLAGNIYTTGPITGACSVTASFILNSYVVSVMAGANGAITPPPPSTTVYFNTAASFNLTPDPGYYANVTGTCGGSLDSLGTTYTTLPITSACTVVANFALNNYSVTGIAIPTLGGTITTATPTVSNNSTANFIVTAATGYRITSISGCNGATITNAASPFTYTTGGVTATCSVTASFTIISYPVTGISAANGSISPTSVSVDHGMTTTFTVTPDINFDITGVSGCGGTLTGNAYVTGPITGACAVTANFALHSYTVTASAGTNGTITPAASTVILNTTTTFTVVPNIGYSASVAGTCGGSLIGTTYTTGPITAACTVAASFTINSYPVTATVGLNGAITPMSMTVTHGATTSFTVTPKSNYPSYTARVTGCNGTLAGTTYTTGPITAPCIVAARFGIFPMLNDTGVERCVRPGQSFLILTACDHSQAIALNNAQDGMIGRDADGYTNGPAADGNLGFSFSKVCNSGEPQGVGACSTDPVLGSAAGDWGCTHDNVTSLLWEVKTTDGLLRDMNKTYTNYDSTSAAQKYDATTLISSYPTQAEVNTATNSVGYINSVNSQKLCGHNDWRLPTADELLGIVDYSVTFPYPSLDAAWFPNTLANTYWASSPYAGNASYGWLVDFYGGRGSSGNRSSPHYLRLVR